LACEESGFDDLLLLVSLPEEDTPPAELFERGWEVEDRKSECLKKMVAESRILFYFILFFF